jgi:hypothetical protein
MSPSPGNLGTPLLVQPDAVTTGWESEYAPYTEGSATHIQPFANPDHPS